MYYKETEQDHLISDLISKGDFNTANSILKKNKTKPDELFYFRLSEVQLNLFDFEEAKKVLQLGLALNPEDANLRSSLIIYFFAIGEFEKGLKLLSNFQIPIQSMIEIFLKFLKFQNIQLLDDQSDNKALPLITYLLSYNSLDTGEYENLLNKLPPIIWYAYYKFLIYLIKKRTISHIQFVTITQNHAPNWKRLAANLLMREDQHTIAIELLSSLEKLDPQSLNNLALCYRAIGLSEEGLKILVGSTHEHAEILNTIGVLFLDVFDNENAKVYFDAALAKSPLPITIWNKSSLAGSITQAVEDLENNKGDFKSFVATAHYKSKLGDRTEVQKILSSKLKDHSWCRSIQILDQDYNDAIPLFNRKEVFDYCLDQVPTKNVFLEFGVWSGRSFRYLSKHFEHAYGFDTFTGLPEDWHGTEKGSYSALGKIPSDVPGTFIKGEFDKTLPQFFKQYTNGEISMINFDADLYSSTKLALDAVRANLSDKTICVFDEFFLNANFERDEIKAVKDFCNEHGLQHEMLAYSIFTKQAVLRFF